MATSSFDRSFVVTDPETIAKLKYDLAHPKKVSYAKRNLKKDAEEGIALLKQRLYHSAT